MRAILLQWSPVLETGNTCSRTYVHMPRRVAAMEPGLRDREYDPLTVSVAYDEQLLQWSPVLETGNTGALRPAAGVRALAAMEPGLRDREYDRARGSRQQRGYAAMEPGLRDREYQHQLCYTPPL